MKGDDGRLQWRQNACPRSIMLYCYRLCCAKGFQGFLHLRVVNVGIDHGGGEVGVPEHHLTLRDLRSMMESEVAG
jgi:hypothetical protein